MRPAALNRAAPTQRLAATLPLAPRLAATLALAIVAALPAALALAVGAAVLAAVAPPPAAAQYAMADRVDPIFADFAAYDRPGCAVAVSQEGRVTLERAYGMAELEHGVRNTPATVFEAGSVSKQFTAAATVLLALEGKISLEDDIRDYIPEVPDYGYTITIRHLLNHTSGLRDWGSVAGLEGWPRTSRVHTHDHVLDIVSRQRALNYPPGERYSYTNTGYNLQAVLVERVSGMPFAEFSQRRIFDRLGLYNTEWRDDFTRLVPNRAQAYSPSRGGYALDMPFENVHGNGGLLTTVGDLLRWTESLETAELGERFVAEMHRTGVLTSGESITYASGLVVGQYRGVPEVSHSGSTAGYRAYVARYPAQRVGVAVLCNAANASAGGLAHEVAELWLGNALAPVARRDAPEPGGQQEPPPRWEPTPADLGAFVGSYHSPDANATYTVSVQDGQLMLQRPFRSPSPLRPGREADNFGSYRFIRDAAGRVTELSVSASRVFDMRFERVR